MGEVIQEKAVLLVRGTRIFMRWAVERRPSLQGVMQNLSVGRRTRGLRGGSAYLSTSHELFSILKSGGNDAWSQLFQKSQVVQMTQKCI